MWPVPANIHIPRQLWNPQQLTEAPSPLLSLLRCSISAWSFSSVSLCCCCRKWMFLCRDATRGSASLWQGTSASLLAPLSAAGTSGSGCSRFAAARRGEKGFTRRPTRGQCGKWRNGGKFWLDITLVYSLGLATRRLLTKRTKLPSNYSSTISLFCILTVL